MFNIHYLQFPLYLLASIKLSSAQGDGDYTISPPYHVDPALTDLGNPSGKLFKVTMITASSKIFNGTDPTFIGAECDGPTPGECCRKSGNCTINAQRTVSVYIPVHYVDGYPSPILVMQDGPGYLSQVAFALDNLAAANSTRHLPSFIAISIENGGSDAIKSERGLEYDTMSDRYARFVETEVLPAILGDPNVLHTYPKLKFTSDPNLRGTFGCSSGGAAALTMAYFRPDLFRRVIAYSGTFVDQQDHADRTGAFTDFPLGAWSYHSGLQLISSGPKLPLRVFHHASEMDLGYNLTSAAVDDNTGGKNNTEGDPNAWTDGHHNWLVAGNRTAAALKQRGYAYRHIYSLGAHHCDPAVLMHTLADTLVWLWSPGWTDETPSHD